VLITPTTPQSLATASWTFYDLPAGMYQLSGTWRTDATAPTSALAAIWVNGTPIAEGTSSNTLTGISGDNFRDDDSMWRRWQVLDGTVDIPSDGVGDVDAVVVKVIAGGGQSFHADAVRLERIDTTQIDYDANGNVIKTTDALGRISHTTYDELDRVSRTYTPDQEGNFHALVQQSVYDGYGNIKETTTGHAPFVSQTAPPPTILLPQVTARTFDSQNRLRTETLAVGSTLPLPKKTGFKYDDVGNLLEKIELPGETDQRRTSYRYDGLNRLIREELNADATGVNVHVTENSYDKFQNLTVKENPGVDPRAIENALIYDALGRTVIDTSSGQMPSGVERRAMRYSYDAEGSLIAAIDPLQRMTVNEYDRLGRRVKATTPDPDRSGPLVSRTSVFQYDVSGNLTSTANGNGEVDRNAYDSQGQLVRSSNGRGETTLRQYDAVGNLKRMVDPSTNVTTYRYDALNRKQEEVTPTGTREFDYDGRGRLWRTVDRGGRFIVYGYDALDRLVNEYWYIDVNEQSGNWSDHNQTRYDDLGGVKQQRRRNRNESNALQYVVTDAYLYDKLDRLIEHSNQSTDGNGSGPAFNEAYAYSYDAGYLRSDRLQFVGSLSVAKASTSSYIGPFGELRYVVDQGVVGGGLTSTAARVDFSYDLSGAITSSIRKTDWDAGANNYQNHVKTEYGYDDAGKLETLSHYAQELTAGVLPGYHDLVEFGYEYDLADRINQITGAWDTSIPAFSKHHGNDSSTAPVVENFTFDAAGQLIFEMSSDGAGGTYAMGTNGNRAMSTVQGFVQYSHQGQNRLVYDQKYRYAYNAEGNLEKR
jgi:YD repeat-containing protein